MPLEAPPSCRPCAPLPCKVCPSAGYLYCTVSSREALAVARILGGGSRIQEPSARSEEIADHWRRDGGGMEVPIRGGRLVTHGPLPRTTRIFLSSCSSLASLRGRPGPGARVLTTVPANSHVPLLLQPWSGFQWKCAHMVMMYQQGT